MLVPGSRGTPAMLTLFCTAGVPWVVFWQLCSSSYRAVKYSVPLSHLRHVGGAEPREPLGFCSALIGHMPRGSLGGISSLLMGVWQVFGRVTKHGDLCAGVNELLRRGNICAGLVVCLGE